MVYKKFRRALLDRLAEKKRLEAERKAKEAADALAAEEGSPEQGRQ